MLAGQLVGHRLDERLFLERLEDRAARLQHQLEELLLVILGIVREERLTEQFVVRFVKLVVVHRAEYRRG